MRRFKITCAHVRGVAACFGLRRWRWLAPWQRARHHSAWWLLADWPFWRHRVRLWWGAVR